MSQDAEDRARESYVNEIQLPRLKPITIVTLEWLGQIIMEEAIFAASTSAGAAIERNMQQWEAISDAAYTYVLLSNIGVVYGDRMHEEYVGALTEAGTWNAKLARDVEYLRETIAVAEEELQSAGRQIDARDKRITILSSIITEAIGVFHDLGHPTAARILKQQFGRSYFGVEPGDNDYGKSPIKDCPACRAVKDPDGHYVDCAKHERMRR